MRAKATGSQVKQCKDTQANNTIVSDMAKEIRNFTTVDNSRTCSNGGS